MAYQLFLNSTGCDINNNFNIGYVIGSADELVDVALYDSVNLLLETGSTNTFPSFSGVFANSYGSSDYTLTAVGRTSGQVSAITATITCSGPTITPPISIDIAVTNATTFTSADGTIELLGVTGGTGPYTYYLAETIGPYSPNYPKHNISVNGTHYTGYTFTSVSGTGTGGQFPVTGPVGVPSSGRPAGDSLYIVYDNADGLGTNPIAFLVLRITSPPPFIKFAVTDVTTFGGTDGTLELVSVTGGTPPYSYFYFQTCGPPYSQAPASTQNIYLNPPQNIFINNVFYTGNTITGATTQCGTAQSGPVGVIGPGEGIGDFNMIVYDFSNGNIGGNNKLANIILSIGYNPPPLGATYTKTNVLCHGANNGTINVAPSGGTGSYTYLWNDGQTSQNRSGLSPNTFSITITDSSGNTFNIPNIVITDTSPTLSATFVKTNVSCNGANDGTINVIPSGGTGSYTYLWNDSVTTQNRTGLSAGSHSCIITDSNGCTTNISTTITQPAAISGSAAVSGNTVTVTASNGIPAYQYAISGGSYQSSNVFNSVPNGLYNILIKDVNNCTKTIYNVRVGPHNSGYIICTTLEQYYPDDDEIGITKPNTFGDPDYIPPVFNPGACPP